MDIIGWIWVLLMGALPIHGLLWLGIRRERQSQERLFRMSLLYLANETRRRRRP